MSTLKRKDAPEGERPLKSAKKSKETQSAAKDATTRDAKPPKSNSRSTASTVRPKSSAVSVLKDEEPIFPRGGGSVLTPLEQKKIQLEAKADAMKEDEFDTGKKPAKSKEKKTKKSSSKKDSDFGSKPDEESIKAQSLSFKVCVPLWLD